MSKADERSDISVQEYIDSLDDEQVKTDTQVLTEVMQRISGSEPILYGIGTIGFGVYHYKYESGREGDAHTLGFYPRKGKITSYLMDGTARYGKLLDKLGKHSITGYCIYIKRLDDIQMSVLEEIIRLSYQHISKLYQSGPINQILWQSD